MAGSCSTGRQGALRVRGCSSPKQMTRKSVAGIDTAERLLHTCRSTLDAVKYNLQASSRGHRSTYERRAWQQQSRYTRQGLS